MNSTIPAVKYFLTEVGKSPNGDPVVVGYDFCRCGYHITICQCVGGPSEPRYITAMREKEAKREAEKEQKATPVTATPVVSRPTKIAVPLATQADDTTCTGCSKLVDESNGDRNDDGTYTCWDCQAAS